MVDLHGSNAVPSLPCGDPCLLEAQYVKNRVLEEKEHPVESPHVLVPGVASNTAGSLEQQSLPPMDATLQTDSLSALSTQDAEPSFGHVSFVNRETPPLVDQPDTAHSTAAPSTEAGDTVEPLLVIDGESQVDDMMMAACFANYEHTALKRIEETAVHQRSGFSHTQTQRRFSESGGFAIATNERFDLGALLAQHGLETESSTEEDDDEDKEDEEINGVDGDDNIEEDEDEVRRGLAERVATQPKRAIPSLNESGHHCLKTTTCAKRALGDNDDGDSFESDSEAHTHTSRKEPLWLLDPIVLEGLPADVSPSATLSPAGTVHSVVESTVLVHGHPGSNPLDLGSVLCTQDRKIIGTVSDTFGPVAVPFYVVCDAKVSVKEGDMLFADMSNSSFVLELSGSVPSYLKTAFESEDCAGVDSDDAQTENTKRLLKDSKEKNSKPFSGPPRATPRHITVSTGSPAIAENHFRQADGGRHHSRRHTPTRRPPYGRGPMHLNTAFFNGASGTCAEPSGESDAFNANPRPYPLPSSGMHPHHPLHAALDYGTLSAQGPTAPTQQAHFLAAHSPYASHQAVSYPYQGPTHSGPSPPPPPPPPQNFGYPHMDVSLPYAPRHHFQNAPWNQPSALPYEATPLRPPLSHPQRSPY